MNRKNLRQYVRIVSFIVVLFALGVTGWYVWILDRHPSPKGSDNNVAEIQAEEYCAPAGGVCLTPPAQWINTSDNDHYIGLMPLNETVRIDYSFEAMTKVTACDPGDCLMKVVSIEPFASIPDTMLVKAVNQRPKHDAITVTEFLIATSDAQKYGLATGKTSDIGVEAMPMFNRTVNGRAYQQHLEGLGYKPGNYETLAEAERWFDTPEARMVHSIITSLKLSE